METLISKLKSEAGLTEEQAIRSIQAFNEYMNENDLKIDWEEFLKAKSRKVSEATKSAFNQLFGEITWRGKAADNINSMTDKAKEAIDKARNAAADFLATDDHKK